MKIIQCLVRELLPLADLEDKPGRKYSPYTLASPAVHQGFKKGGSEYLYTVLQYFTACKYTGTIWVRDWGWPPHSKFHQYGTILYGIIGMYPHVQQRSSSRVCVEVGTTKGTWKFAGKHFFAHDSDPTMLVREHTRYQYVSFECVACAFARACLFFSIHLPTVRYSKLHIQKNSYLLQ